MESEPFVESFVDVIVLSPVKATAPGATAQTFTYHLPDDLEGRPGVGSLVVVPFGSRRLYGVVVGLSDESPVPETRPVRLSVFDAAGRAVYSRSWKSLKPGVHRLKWNGKTDSGASLGAGVYFYTVESAGQKDSGKLLFVR